MKKSGKLAYHVVNSNNAIGSLPTLKISVGMLALFEKIYYEVLILKYRGGCTIRCEKYVAARHYAVICKQLLNANYRNRVR